MAGWYIYCPDCGAAVFLARWRWLACFRWWVMTTQPNHDALLRCGDNSAKCDLVYRETHNAV